MSIEDIRKPENATILQTYAVLHMGATEEQIGGIDGRFWPKTLAIFRKCQADWVWGNAVKSVNQAELGVVWTEVKDSEGTLIGYSDIKIDGKTYTRIEPTAYASQWPEASYRASDNSVIRVQMYGRTKQPRLKTTIE